MQLPPGPDPATLRQGASLRWAVLAPGEIATDFTRTLHANTHQRVVSVGSRSLERSRRFAQEFGVPGVHAAYEDAVADPAVEAVYVASPNSTHADLAALAIDAGKAVLIEKPLALHAAQVRALADHARSRGVFAMEAMWTRYQPRYQLMASLLQDGVIGRARLATAHVGWQMTGRDPADKIFDPALGGGVGLDMGVYGIWFAHFALGRPELVRAVGTLRGPVEEQLAVSLLHDAGAVSAVTATMAVTNSGFAAVHGSQGSVVVPDHFVFPGGLVLTRDGETVQWQDRSGLTGRDGLAWQAGAMAEYVRQGRLESPLHSLEDSAALAEVLDAARSQAAA